MRTLILFVLGLFGPAFCALNKPAGCGSDFGCYTGDCSGGCDFLVTWQDDSNGGVKMTLSRPLEDAKLRWMAVGFSKDQSMGEDSVVECDMTTDALAIVLTSWNPADYNELLSPDEKLGISNVVGVVADGILRCEFTRQIAIADEPKYYDLSSESYYLLVANGEMNGADKDRHSLTDRPVASPKKVDLLSNEDVSGVAKEILIKVHGCLMVFAWVFCASIGLVLARHFKPVWPNSKICREKVWFAFHRMLMVFALLTCVAAFVIIFVEVEGWAELPGASQFQRAHPILGVIVTFLVIVNPLLALCRPHPDDPNRPIFNWTHWLVGICAHFLSMLTLIIGVSLSRASTPFYVVWILVAYVIYQILVELVLEIHECVACNKAKRYGQDGFLKEPKGATFKKVVLGIHVLIITGFTVAVIVLISIN